MAVPRLVAALIAFAQWTVVQPAAAADLWWVHGTPSGREVALRLFGDFADLKSTRVQLRLEPADGHGPAWRLAGERQSDHMLHARISSDVKHGTYRVRLAGMADGGACGDATISLAAPRPEPRTVRADTVDELHSVLDSGSPATVLLGEGIYELWRPLAIPEGVSIEGAGAGRTVLRIHGRFTPVAGLVSTGGTLQQMASSESLVPGVSGGAASAAIVMFHSHSALRSLSVDGGGAVDIAVAMAGTRSRPVRHVSIEDVHIDGLAPFHGVHGQTQAVLMRHVEQSRLLRNEIRGQGPAIYMEDVADSRIAGNSLSGEGEAVISGREAGVRRTLIESNRFVSGNEGAVQAVRAIWLSTLFGSVYRNYIGNNEGRNFHPPPGTGQNRGEAILLETALTHPYFGAPVASGADTVDLPESGPDWALLEDSANVRATRLADYFVVVVDGRGRGQSRRIIARSGKRLTLECNWAVVPDKASRLVVTELIYRNLIVGNRIADAMSGVQLWLSSAENIIAGNELSDLSREGILVFADAKGGPQSVPAFWPVASNHMAGFNRGIGVSFFNRIQGNVVTRAATGIEVSAGDFRAKQGADTWPLVLGNVVRANTIRDAGSAIRSGARYP
jgi:nitrous oxidase accessory protein NosD